MEEPTGLRNTEKDTFQQETTNWKKNGTAIEPGVTAITTDKYKLI